MNSTRPRNAPERDGATRREARVSALDATRLASRPSALDETVAAHGAATERTDDALDDTRIAEARRDESARSSGSRGERSARDIAIRETECSIDESSAPRGSQTPREFPPRGTIGRFRILRVLGEGGMGLVYAAYNAA